MAEVRFDLEPGETFVVASLEFWEKMAAVCRTLANDYSPDRDENRVWKEIARAIETQAHLHCEEDEWESWYEDEDEE